jgi:hypothetical protein
LFKPSNHGATVCLVSGISLVLSGNHVTTSGVTDNPATKNRFGASSLHQRDSRSALFEGYTGDAASRRPVSASPSRGYGYGGYGAPSPSPLGAGGYDGGAAAARGGFRSATPNRRGQYSDAVLNELESQNDAQVEGILGKVKVLKDVSFSGHSPVFPLVSQGAKEMAARIQPVELDRH